MKEQPSHILPESTLGWRRSRGSGVRGPDARPHPSRSRCCGGVGGQLGQARTDLTPAAATLYLAHQSVGHEQRKPRCEKESNPRIPTLNPSTLQVKEGTSNEEHLRRAMRRIALTVLLVVMAAKLMCIVLFSDSPKDTRVSASRSGPVPENTNVTLTCSSDANPPVTSYTWYRAGGDQETVIGTGQNLTITASTVNRFFFCKAGNDLGDGRSENHEVDVQYSPKDTRVSASPSGPVPENTNVTLTCSSDANPPVTSYTWYRAGGDQETVIGTGPVLTITASTVNRFFFCKAGNDLGDGRSENHEVDVQYSPKDTRVSASRSGPVPENTNVTLTCSSDANPPVTSYTWYRAGGDQETVIGTGPVLTITASTVNRFFFCKAGNDLGDGRSENHEVDVQYSPKDTRVSSSPSGPVPENTNVTLTCSSDANPPVTSYTWYRAGGDQETVIGTGPVLTITASTVNRFFFCKAGNDFGDGRSENHEVDVQYSPKDTHVSASPSGPVPENTNVTLTCSSDANPPVTSYTWYRAGGDQETVIGTGPVLTITASTVNRFFFCKAGNDLGDGRPENHEVDVQGHMQTYGIYIGMELLSRMENCEKELQRLERVA
ncbi:B-cell receptor CD22-like [Xenentodon cancila]